MPEVSVQTCRSCASATPGRRLRPACTSATSTCSGACLQQDAQRARGQLVRARQDEQADRDGHDGVGVPPAGRAR